jgi:hypothetical protein
MSLSRNRTRAQQARTVSNGILQLRDVLEAGRLHSGSSDLLGRLFEASERLDAQDAFFHLLRFVFVDAKVLFQKDIVSN